MRQGLSDKLADYDSVRQVAIDSLFRALSNECEGTLVVDEQARIVWINASYAERFGCADPADALGREVEDVIPNSQLRDVLQSGQPMLLDIMNTPRGPLVVTRLPLRDADGAVVGAVGFALFGGIQSLSPLVSKIHRMGEELAATRATLAQTRRAKYTLDSFIGSSPAAASVRRQGERAAQMDSPVLLLGETGTGKEVLAHAIHAASLRAHKPLVTLNMAAIPETLLEAELFGAAAGAYTGAERQGRVGKLQLADGGTLFLDEIGDLPPGLQVKLLRVLQDKEFEPLGSNKVVHSDIRIIAATSVRLTEKVERGEFRADLYYRLNVLEITLPPLRERLADLPELAEALLAELAAGGAGRYRLGADALVRLAAQRWPGNVRELKNALERATMFCEGRELSASDFATLPSASSAVPTAMLTPAAALPERMAAFEAGLLRQALAECGGQVAQTAQYLGIGRATLYKKLAAYGIAPR